MLEKSGYTSRSSLLHDWTDVYRAVNPTQSKDLDKTYGNYPVHTAFESRIDFLFANQLLLGQDGQILNASIANRYADNP
jgi:hypothetical protein